MGVVYEAVHEQIGQRVAAKVLYQQLAERADYMERFLREARASSLIRHDGLAKIFDFGRMEDGPPYILMEFLEGDLLRIRMDRLSPPRRMDVASALRIARQIASALSAAHAKGVVHRDLKPENVMIVSDSEAPAGERVKLLDFGVAKFLASPHRMSMRGGQILGTPAYMSPEQRRGARDIGARSDSYALGVLLYEMLTGSLPVEGTPQELLSRRTGEEPPPAIERAPEVPVKVSELVARLMNQDPEARPTMIEATMAIKQLAGDLGDANEPGAVSARSDALSAHSAVGSQGTPPAPGAAPPPAVASTANDPARAPTAEADIAFLPTADANVPAKVEPTRGFRSWMAAVPPSVRQLGRALLVAALAALTLGAAWLGLRSRPRPMVLVPAGSYLMGSSHAEAESAYEWSQGPDCVDCSRETFAREQPARVVSISALYMDTTEVQNAEFAGWLSANPSLRVDKERLVYAGDTLIYDLGERAPTGAEPSPAGIEYLRGRFSARSDMARLPVVQVTWDGALRYCADQGKRLPTEAEWEHAARGAEGWRFPWGEAPPSCDSVVFARNKGLRCARLASRPAPVHSAEQDVSPLGVADLGGNVAEWVLDRARRRYPDCPEPCRDPLVSDNGPEDGGPRMRVVRGGSFDRPAYASRGAGRTQRLQDLPAADVGFRCVKPAR